MPQLSRFFIRSGMACLVLGLVASVIASVSPAMATIRPTWFHLITVGWLTQLIFGVALWMFPRPPTAARRDAWGWFGFWALNAGLLLRLLAEPLKIFSNRMGGLLVLSAFLQLGAIIALVASLWPRVRER
ncbi:MAG: hypothetical protein ABI613_04965 [Gemmatimonadota bacterium]